METADVFLDTRTFFSLGGSAIAIDAESLFGRGRGVLGNAGSLQRDKKDGPRQTCHFSWCSQQTA
jgi:hypothetical protein